jgi:hypothetical protein
MTPSVRPLSTELTFATPFEWRGIGVPGTSSGFQPVNQLGGVRWHLTGQCTPGQDPLDGLGHVQPGSAQWRLQRHDAVFEQPHHETHGQVAGEVVHDQQHPQWWQLVEQRWFDRQASLPALPRGAIVILRHYLRRW